MQETLRAQPGTETPWLNDVVPFLRNLPSATFDYFLEGFDLVTV